MKKNSYDVRLIDYVAALGIIISSGTAFFYLYHAGLTLLGLLVVAIVYFITSKQKSFRVNSFFVVYSLLLVINYFLYGYDMNLVGDVIFLFSTLLIISNTNYFVFKKAFLNVMVVLGIVSIVLEILYWLGFIHPFLYNTSDELLGHYLYFFHVFGGGLWGEHNQLSGIFWEPGIYQMALNLALIMNIDEWGLSNNKQKKHTLKLLTVIIAIILTMSTTGYLTLGVVLIGKMWSKEGKSFAYIILFLLVILCFLIIIKYSTVISGKFTEENASFIARSNDFFALLNVISEHPFLGSGVHSKLYMSLANKYNMTGSQSAGLLLQTAQLGVFWLISFYYSLNKEYTKRKIEINRWFYIIAISFLCIGEPLVYAPFILINVLPFKEYYPLCTKRF